MTIQNRYDFVLLFDVQDGNPNGDPDAGNLPRLDPESGHGITTDVCLKRKIRNYVQLKKKDEQGFNIYVKENAILVEQHEKAYQALGVDLTKDQGKRKGGDKVAEARQWMCKNFYDIRTFGAVMGLNINCGQVRGPVQLTFGRSIDPVVALEHTITRVAVATKEESEKMGGENHTMGRKYTIPYGLYRAHGFISAHLANQTYFAEIDLALLWEALTNMFEHDRSAARGNMNTRGLYIFKHDNELGNAPAHVLFDLINVKRKNENTTAQGFSDYIINIDESHLPSSVKLIRAIG